MLGGRAAILEGDIIFVLTGQVKLRVSLRTFDTVTSKTTSKPFSDDAPQKTHCATGSRASVAVDLKHDMTKEREETPHPTPKKKKKRETPHCVTCDQE